MFYCETNLSCDICGIGRVSSARRIHDCASKALFRLRLKEEGWKVVFGNYDVCKRCLQHYGMKEIRRILRARTEATK